MEEKVIKAKELAEMWNISTRRVNQLCAEGSLAGVYKAGKSWLIPSSVEKPLFLRETSPVYGTSRRKTTELLPCPVGITSFRDISQAYYYADKTLFLKALIDNSGMAYLFTRPHKWGTTLLLDMVKTYFEKTNQNTSAYFKDKKIWSIGKKYRDCQGRFPVIALSLKNAAQSDWEGTYRSLKFILREETKRHAELLDSDKIVQYDKNYLLKVLNDEADEIDYQFLPGKLSSMLSAHYGEKVVVLIDDYDAPIQQGYLCGYYEKVSEFIINMLGIVLKDNHKLRCGIMTGNMRVPQRGFSGSLNNLVVCSVYDNKFSEFFGLTREEVQEICTYFSKEDKLEEIRDWYGGFSCGSREIYKPQSVMSYFANGCKPQIYCPVNNENAIIKQLLYNLDDDKKKELDDLLQGKQMKTLLDPYISLDEMGRANNSVIGVLVTLGFISIQSILDNWNLYTFCTVSAPNNEMLQIWQKELTNTCCSMDTRLIDDWKGDMV